LIHKTPVISSHCLYINTHISDLDNGGNIAQWLLVCVKSCPHSAGAHSFQFWRVGRALYYVNDSMTIKIKIKQNIK
jgi:hypothetical protein